MYDECLGFVRWVSVLGLDGGGGDGMRDGGGGFRFLLL